MPTPTEPRREPRTEEAENNLRDIKHNLSINKKENQENRKKKKRKTGNKQHFPLKKQEAKGKTKKIVVKRANKQQVIGKSTELWQLRLTTAPKCYNGKTC